MATFGEKIKKLREQLGYTQEKFSTYTGVSLQTLRQYEQANKKTIPDIKTVKKIADYFGITIDSLIYDELEITSRSALKGTLSDLNISTNSIDNLKKYNTSLNIIIGSDYCHTYAEKMELLLIINSITDLINSLLISKNNIIDSNQLKFIIDRYSLFVSNDYAQNICLCRYEQINNLKKAIGKKKQVELDVNIKGILTGILQKFFYTQKYLEGELCYDFNHFIKTRFQYYDYTYSSKGNLSYDENYAIENRLPKSSLDNK